ncbi:MAG: tetratricopeptide repeat protein [Gemmatimonadales bacterium]
MTDAAAGSPREGSPTPQAFWTTFLLIFVAIAILFSLDTTLARIDRDETQAEATAHFEEGRRLIAAGDYREAVDRLRTAAFLERGNRDYRLALGEALAGAGKPVDAEAQLDEVLREHATWGPANLAMARALVLEGRLPEATSYYHRAIYGQWDDGEAAERRVSARFELISLLVREESQQELLAELLPLLDEAPDSLPLRKELGHLFVVAGSPTRAGTIFREILRQDPEDPAAHAGLGEAEFALGNYRSARSALLTARRLAPDDSSIVRNLDRVERVLALDPSRRGLSREEQLRRSLTLVELAARALELCTGPTPPVEIRATLDSARSRLAPRPRSRAASYEANLDLAERAWSARQSICSTPASADDPLSLVLARLAQ